MSALGVQDTRADVPYTIILKTSVLDGEVSVGAALRSIVIDEADESPVVKPAKALSIPVEPPTQKERLKHEVLHVPFETWCVHCVRGRAADDPHVH